MSLPDAVEDLVHEPTQVEGDRVHLTAGEVYEVVEPGRIDFGGGELEAAGLDPHPTTHRSPDDDYAWWHLREGTYLLEYNESLGDERAFLQPRTELLERGGSHPSLRVDGQLPLVPLTVATELRIKANARVSTLLPES